VALAETVPASGSNRRAVAGGSVTGSVGELLRAGADDGPAWRWLALIVGSFLAMVAAILFYIWPRHAAAPVAPIEIGPAAVAPTTTRAPVAPAPVAPAPAPAPTTSKTPVAEALGQEVLLTIKGTEGAEVLVDGNLVGMVPLEVPLPRKAGPRHLEVRLEGYHAWPRTIAGDTDVKLTAILKPLSSHTRAGGHNAPVVRNPFDR
jgi:hypothetical protein